MKKEYVSLFFKPELSMLYGSFRRFPSNLSIVVKRCVHSKMKFKRGITLYFTPAPMGKLMPKLLAPSTIPTVVPMPKMAYGVMRDNFL